MIGHKAVERRVLSFPVHSFAGTPRTILLASSFDSITPQRDCLSRSSKELSVIPLRMERERAWRHLQILLDLSREAITKPWPSPGRCQLLQVGIVRRLVKAFPGRQLCYVRKADQERAHKQANRCNAKKHRMASNNVGPRADHHRLCKKLYILSSRFLHSGWRR
jgi:hypothetical protein